MDTIEIVYFGNEGDFDYFKLRMVLQLISTPSKLSITERPKGSYWCLKVTKNGQTSNFFNITCALKVISDDELNSSQNVLLEHENFFTDLMFAHLQTVASRTNSCFVSKLQEMLHIVDLDRSKNVYPGGPTFIGTLWYSNIWLLVGFDKAFNLSEFPNLKSWFDGLSVNSVVQAVLKKAVPDGDPLSFKSCISQFKVPYNILSIVESQETNPVKEEKMLKEDDLLQAKEKWFAGVSDSLEHEKHPKLPKENSRNILITSALPYVNNVPHLGNIIGCVLSGDMYSRFCRGYGYNSLYVCGTDEYGTATETKALQEGVSPKEICDKYSAIHESIYSWFNIDFDHFGRTSTPKQTQISQEIFWDLHKAGFTSIQSMTQLKCTKCSRFLADRFVHGTCPLCGYDDARGDQCDKCGKLLHAIDLVQPKCALCETSPITQDSQHIFLDLDRIQPKLEAHLNSVKALEANSRNCPNVWTDSARQATRPWLRDGLLPRCITRDLSWGTPCPLEGFDSKVFYVWFDAPIGYMSITAGYTDQWRQWWQNSENVELINFLGKDNVPFHSVVFPSTLLATGKPWTLVRHMSSTEYLNYEGGKFSKSRGTGVFGDAAKETGIPADVFRFYLLMVRPERGDSSFSWSDLAEKNNAELLNNLGNFIHRGLSFVSNRFDGVVPAGKQELSSDETVLLASINQKLVTYIEALEETRLTDAIRAVLAISKLGNQFMQNEQPWVLFKSDLPQCQHVMRVVLAIVACLTAVLTPVMPAVADRIRSFLNLPSTACRKIRPFISDCLSTGHKIGTPEPLFIKIEPTQVEEWRQKFKGAGSPVKNAGGASNADLEAQINAQGDVVRSLKAAQPKDKAKIDEAVKKLLALKAELSLKPKVESNSNNQSVDLDAQIKAQGDIVRSLKAAQPKDKAKIDEAVKKLLALKAQLPK